MSNFNGNSRETYRIIREKIADMFPDHHRNGPDVYSSSFGNLMFSWQEGHHQYSVLFSRDEFLSLLEQDRKWASPRELVGAYYERYRPEESKQRKEGSV